MEATRLILDVLEDYPDGVCDSSLHSETKLPSHQDVNGTCRMLERAGKLIRLKDSGVPCSVCGKFSILNKLIAKRTETQIVPHR